ncbi:MULTISPECIES: hypothetical protein [unclassified Xanthobacter]|uniref:hypothetical protein n=1 Tax=unclassified Xanthobacter TaxID=2623496 RepID=UPI001EE0524D|nr:MULTISPECIES: hypothetical protein [unclassified Xanthobacter]
MSLLRSPRRAGRRAALPVAAFLLAAGLVAAPAFSVLQAAETAAPAAATLLFEAPQLAGTTPGQTLRYDYHRKMANADLGPSYDDRITLQIEPAAEAPPGARTVKVDFFGPERHRAAGPFEGVNGNPVLVLFLEHHVGDLSGLLKGNPRYFKNAIRAALRDKAEVSPLQITRGGHTYAGWQVKVAPFAGDPNAKRMRGLEALTYTFDVAPELPGAIARIAVTADVPEGRLWEEALSYEP